MVTSESLTQSTMVCRCRCTACVQGLTLVHFSAQPEPFLTHDTTQTPLNTSKTTPKCTPYPTESAQVEV